MISGNSEKHLEKILKIITFKFTKCSNLTMLKIC